MTNYIFSIAGDFTAGIAPGKLRLELDPNITLIIPALLSIGTSGDECTIVFASALSSTEEAALDAVVAAHDGVPLLDGTRDIHGNPVVAPTFLHASESARLEGYTLECEPGQTAIIDIETTVQLLVQGGQFWTQNCTAGDKTQFCIVDKNDVLGLHTLYGAPLGTPIELVRYVKNYYLPTAEIWREEIVMPTVAPVAPGLFLRTIYEAGAGGTTRHLGVLYRWYIAN